MDSIPHVDISATTNATRSDGGRPSKPTAYSRYHLGSTLAFLLDNEPSNLPHDPDALHALVALGVIVPVESKPTRHGRVRQVWRLTDSWAVPNWAARFARIETLSLSSESDL